MKLSRKRCQPHASAFRGYIKRRATQPLPAKIYIDLTADDQPNTPSASKSYFDKLQEDARNSRQPKVVENAMVAGTMMDALLSDGFDPEEPVDRTLLL